MLTHRNLVANAFHKTLACSLERDDVLLAVAPLFHVAGTAPLLGLVWLGGTIVVLPSFDPAVSLDLIERHGVTVLVPVPTMVAAMVDEQCRRPRDASLAAPDRPRRARPSRPRSCAGPTPPSPAPSWPTSTAPPRRRRW